MNNKKVLVFGTFDGIHPGHIFFLNKAKELGDLYISLASNKSILTRKIKAPKKTESQRLEDIKNLNVGKVTIGDTVLGRWSEIKKIKPTIIAVGYDQKTLKANLKKIQKDFGFTIVTIKSYMPKKYHSSIIKKTNVLS